MPSAFRQGRELSGRLRPSANPSRGPCASLTPLLSLPAVGESTLAIDSSGGACRLGSIIVLEPPEHRRFAAWQAERGCFFARTARQSSVRICAATTLVLESATAGTGFVATDVSHISQPFGVLLVRSAKASEPVVDGLPTLADAKAAVPRWKIICDSPQREDEQGKTGCHGNDEPH